MASSTSDPPPAPSPSPADGDPGRIMLVGPASLTQRLAAQFQKGRLNGRSQAVRCVPGYLDAIGMASSFRPDLVIGPADLLLDDAANVAAGLRCFAPDARLIAMAGPTDDHSAHAALDGGFDATVLDTIDGDRLLETLGAWRRPASQPPAATSPTAPPPHESAASAPTPASDAGSATGSDAAPQAAPDPAPVAASDDQPLEPTSSAEVQSHADEASAQHDNDADDDEETLLGDIDLIERLLAQEHSLHELAILLIRQRTGCADLDWESRAQASHADHLSAAVTFGSGRFGVLHAPPSAGLDQPTLDAWAGWLARWMALQHRVIELRRLANHDELTGLYNRRYFNEQLRRLLEQAARERFRVTLMLFDIDDFKLYNDHYGHAAGDEILRETARLMRSSVREHDIVARIGGDEFAVIFWDADEPRKVGSRHPADVRAAAERFRRAICEHRFPKLLEGVRETITISGGLASYPWDGASPEALMELADSMAMQSKQQGKNAVAFGPGALRACEQPAE